MENPDTIRIEKVFIKSGVDRHGRTFTPETIKQLHEEVLKRSLISKEQFYAYEKSDGTQHRLEDIQGVIERLDLTEAPTGVALTAKVKLIDTPAGKRAIETVKRARRMQKEGLPVQEPELKLLALGKPIFAAPGGMREDGVEYTNLQLLGVSVSVLPEPGEPA